MGTFLLRPHPPSADDGSIYSKNNERKSDDHAEYIIWPSGLAVGNNMHVHRVHSWIFCQSQEDVGIAVQRTDESLDAEYPHTDDRQEYDGFVCAGLGLGNSEPQLGEVSRMRLAEHAFIMSQRLLKSQNMICAERNNVSSSSGTQTRNTYPERHPCK